MRRVELTSRLKCSSLRMQLTATDGGVDDVDVAVGYRRLCICSSSRSESLLQVCITIVTTGVST